MTQLRPKKMLEELQRRHYSDRTAKTYIRIVRDFAAYFHRPPDNLGPERIRQYQAYLFQSKQLSSATVSQYAFPKANDFRIAQAKPIAAPRPPR